METLERLKALAEKAKLTKADKEFIAGLCDEHGIEIKTSCSECYRDAVVVLYGKYKTEEETEEPTSKYVLRKGLDVYFKGKRINEATISDELAEKLVANGFPTRFFTRMPDAGNE